jgi:NADH dehydrogenase
MILITGATGLIGKNLVRNLLSKGYSIRILARSKEKAKQLFPNVEVVKGDIIHRKHIPIKAFKDVSKVIHLAGLIDYRSPELLFRVNRDGTRHLLEKCKNIDKIIFASSVDVFGKIVGIADENYSCNPIDAYGQSKLEAEEIISSYNIPNVIFRFGIVYGKEAYWFKKGLDFLSFGFVPKTKTSTQIIHVSDVVRALELGLSCKKGLYIIADEKPVSHFRLFKKLIILLGKKPVEVPLWMAKLGSSIIGLRNLFNIIMLNRVFDTSKAKKEIGFKSKADLEIELRDMVEWYKSLK